MNKTIGLLIAAIAMVSCTNETRNPVQSEPTTMVAPIEPGLVVSDFRTPRQFPHSIVMTEQEKYDLSISRINDEFTNERLQLQMCSVVYGANNQVCVNTKREFCSMDTYLDSRGGHHDKPYCGR